MFIDCTKQVTYIISKSYVIFSDIFDADSGDTIDIYSYDNVL